MHNIKILRKEIAIFIGAVILIVLFMYFSSLNNDSETIGYVDEYPFLDKVFK